MRRGRAFSLLQPEPLQLQQARPGIGAGGTQQQQQLATSDGRAAHKGRGPSLPRVSVRPAAADTTGGDGIVRSTRTGRPRRGPPAGAAAAQAAQAAQAAPPPQQQQQQRRPPAPAYTAADQPTPRSSPPPPPTAAAGGAAPASSPADNVPQQLFPASWAPVAAVAFPGLYDPAWHTSLLELLVDVWAAVGQAAGRNGYSVRGGLLSARTRNEQDALIDAAYAYAAACWRSTDERFGACACLTLADALLEWDGLLEGVNRGLPADMLASGLVPASQALLPEHTHATLLSFARDKLGLEWAPEPADVGAWAGLVGRLTVFTAVHPEAHVVSLALLYEDVNVEREEDKDGDLGGGAVDGTTQHRAS
ncbi:hypothetical protein FOA52_010463 [Chlamydomonas sp. UWO 241]|nr:hypothetical protein FOA52_010463 [Chlamydomonas sp. UWO 241]